MMRTPTLLPLLPVLGLWSCTATQPLAVDPEAAATRELVTQNVNATLYQNASAEVAWLFEQGYAFARLKLDANLATADSLPPAVIVDVDETVLDNSPYELENIRAGRTYTPATWKQWTARAEAKALPGAVQFLTYAASRGCAVYYITNRDADEKQATIANLARLGFPMADSVHVRTMEGSSDKTARRDAVGGSHRVVLLVGDQLTDFDQVLKDRSVDQGLPTLYRMEQELSRLFVLLPNATYGYWRDGITGKGSAVEKSGRVRTFIDQRDR